MYTRKHSVKALIAIISTIIILVLVSKWHTFGNLKHYRVKGIADQDEISYNYQLDSNTTIKGLPFHTHGLPVEFPQQYIDINEYDLSNFTFITAASENHFTESKDLIASIQKFFPGKKIYYYDIGLSEDQSKEIQSWCNVVYRKFDFVRYPRHIQHLNSCAFKPLIIYEAIPEFGAIFWMDASVRLNWKANHSNWSSVYKTAITTDGIVQFSITGRDTFQCTHRGMYRYFPVDKEKLKTFLMSEAGIILLYRTEKVFKQIIYWWRLCALTKDCIEPKGHRRNCGNRSRPGISICHRYDQSALNILIAQAFNYDVERLPKGEPFVVVHRHPTRFYYLQRGCGQNDNLEKNVNT